MIRSILAECRQGKPLEKAEALLLSSVKGEEFSLLLEVAAVLRDCHKGKVATFSPKVFIPLTNLCRDFCGYCTFRRAPDEPGAHTLTLDEVLKIAQQGRIMGCTEVLFSLGDRPEAIYAEMREFLAEKGYRRTLDYLFEACKTVLEETGLLPHSNAGLIGRKDLASLRDVNVSLGLMLENISQRLSQPWGPHFNAPDKKPSLRVKTIEEAGKLRIPFTTGLLIGIGENWAERIDSLLKIRELHRHYGHVQEIIVQNFRPKPATPMGDWPEPAMDEVVKTIALARLILGGEMNIQAPPNLNPNSYETYLAAGINDWGGVSPVTVDHINPEAPWPTLETLYRKSSQAGFVLRARLPVYPEFIRARQEFIAPGLWPYVERLCGADGLVKGEENYASVAGAL